MNIGKCCFSAVGAALILAGCSKDEAKNEVRASTEQNNGKVSVVKAFTDANRSTDKAAAMAIVRTIDDAVTTYKLKYNGRLPGSVRDLIDDSEGRDPILCGGVDSIMDPWGKECRLEKNKKKFCVVSAGPNGVFGDDDDVRSRDLEGKSTKR